MMRRLGLALSLLWLSLWAVAQINTDRVMLMGRNALYYEDYVLSIQRFNMVISAKPYLYEPYFFRGLAKFYLEDYVGAEDDCTEAIERNPFQPDSYRLRGLCRVNREHFEDAVADYTKLLEINPKDEAGLHNMVLCYLQLKDYDSAVATVDRMIGYWPKNSELYTIKAQAFLAQKDTAQALASVDRALEVNAYEAGAWNMRAVIMSGRGAYEQAEEAFDRTILQQPREAGHYVNRALVRYHRRNLRGAMNDYDMALELDSANYIGHFNRGLLRAQVGDDNRAIEDFNFVLQLEPDNMIALFNRALMLDNTGDYKGALRDINAVIGEYPNFWAGYSFRASLRRKLGDVKHAELDEFKVLKAQMEKRYGTARQDTAKTTRRQSDRTMEDYNKLVEADPEEDDMPTYDSDYRGQVQNRRTELRIEPELVLTYYPASGDFRRTIYNKEVEQMNRSGVLSDRMVLAGGETDVDGARMRARQRSADDLTVRLARQSDNARLYFARALDEYLLQDYEAALLDADRAVSLDPGLTLAWFLRAQVRIKTVEVRQMENNLSSDGKKNGWSADDLRITCHAALADCEHVLSVSPAFDACHYNMGNIYVLMKDYISAVEAYTRALELNPDFAEAYYNRGVAHTLSGNQTAAVADLSRAGEMGLYKAYNLIKQNRAKPAIAQ